MQKREKIFNLSLDHLREKYFQPEIEIRHLKDNKGKELYKSLPNWRRSKLLPFVPKGDWSLKLSFSEVIWLRILDNLRSLGYPVLDTEKVTDYFFKDAYFHDLPTKNLKSQQEELLNKEALGTLEIEEAMLLNDIESILGNQMLQYGLKFDISYLSNLVVWCISKGEEAGILIFAGGRVVEKKGSQYVNHNDESFDIEEAHIYISIRSLIKEFLKDKELAAIVTPFFLEQEELIVLKELRKKNIKELRIVVQSEKIVRMDSQIQETITKEDADEVKRILQMKNYEEVTINTRDNRTISFKRTKKIMTSGKSGSHD
jgi:hypothetical protein